jgi:predicted NBD/HSP70 family sugar kinase
MSVGNDTVREILRRSNSLDHGIFAIGIEILPWELVGVITNAEGIRIGGCRWHLSGMELQPVVERVAALARYLAASSIGHRLPNPRICLGVQLGGPVDSAKGLVRSLKNSRDDHGKDKPPYEWVNVELANELREETGCLTVVENDAHAFTAYEQKMGVGRQTDSFAAILVRDGVGAGVVVDHKLLPIPMEVGHFPVWPRGRICDCGKRGCIESQAGRRAIPAVVRELTGRWVDGFEAAVALANKDDNQAANARRAFRKAGTSIARGIATILATFGSSHVVIYAPEELIDLNHGGGAAKSFMRAVRNFPKDTFHVVRKCDISTESISQSFRGAQGAALIALSRSFFVPLSPASTTATACYGMRRGGVTVSVALRMLLAYDCCGGQGVAGDGPGVVAGRGRGGVVGGVR